MYTTIYYHYDEDLRSSPRLEVLGSRQALRVLFVIRKASFATVILYFTSISISTRLFLSDFTTESLLG